MCKCLAVSRSGYYDWRRSNGTSLAKENRAISEVIYDIFQEGRQSYGTRRIKRALLKRGFIVSRLRIGRLVRLKGLSCKIKRKFRVTTDSKHHLPISDNHLARNFHATAPDLSYVGDITYIHTGEEWM